MLLSILYSCIQIYVLCSLYRDLCDFIMSSNDGTFSDTADVSGRKLTLQTRPYTEKRTCCVD